MVPYLASHQTLPTLGLIQFVYLQISPLKDSTNAINELRNWHNHISGDISQLKRNLDHDPIACGVKQLLAPIVA